MNDYLVTVNGTYHWFLTEGEMEDFVNNLKEEYLCDTEITYIVQAEDIPVESIRPYKKDLSKFIEDEINKIKHDLSQITQEEYDNMSDSAKTFIKNVGYILNDKKHITFKPNPPKGTVTKC